MMVPTFPGMRLPSFIAICALTTPLVSSWARSTPSTAQQLKSQLQSSETEANTYSLVLRTIFMRIPPELDARIKNEIGAMEGQSPTAAEKLSSQLLDELLPSNPSAFWSTVQVTRDGKRFRSTDRVSGGEPLTEFSEGGRVLDWFGADTSARQVNIAFSPDETQYRGSLKQLGLVLDDGWESDWKGYAGCAPLKGGGHRVTVKLPSGATSVRDYAPDLTLRHTTRTGKDMASYFTWYLGYPPGAGFRVPKVILSFISDPRSGKFLNYTIVDRFEKGESVDVSTLAEEPVFSPNTIVVDTRVHPQSVRRAAQAASDVKVVGDAEDNPSEVVIRAGGTQSWFRVWYIILGVVVVLAIATVLIGAKIRSSARTDNPE